MSSEPKRLLFNAHSIIIAGVLCMGSPAHGTGPDNQRALQAGHGFLNRGMNELAIREYNQFLEDGSDTSGAATAKYGLAVAMQRIGRFADAAETLGEIVRLDDFEFAFEASLLLAQCSISLDDFDTSVLTLQHALGSSPKHERADAAAALLVESLFRNQQFDAAITMATMFDTRWVSSDYRDRADLFGSMSLFETKRYSESAHRLTRLIERSPGSELASNALLLLSQSYEREGDDDRAITGYRRLVQGNDAGLVLDAYVGLATSLRASGQPREAAQAFSALRDASNDIARANDAWLLEGVCLLESDQPRRAEQVLGAGLAVCSRRLDELAFWLAHAQLEQDKPEAAAITLARALDTKPTSDIEGQMRYELAVALSRSDRPDAALATLSSLIEDMSDDPIATDAATLGAQIAYQLGDLDTSLALSRLGASGPNTDSARTASFLEAESLFLAGRLEEAVPAFQSFLQDSLDNERAMDASLRLGSALHQLGRFDDARHVLERVARGRSTPSVHRGSLLILGDVYMQLGDPTKAARALEDFLSFGFDQPGAHDAALLLGRAHADLDDHESAIRAFDIVLQIHPASLQSAQAQTGRAGSLASLDRPELAEAAYRAVLSEPAADSDLVLFALEQLASRLSDRNNSAETIELLRSAVALDTSDASHANVVLRLARELIAAERHDEAIELLTRQEIPDATGEATAWLGIARSRTGQHDAAVTTLRHLKTFVTDTLRSDLHIASVYELAWSLRTLGRLDEARSAYTNLLRLDVPPSLRANALLELAELDGLDGREQQALIHLRRACEIDNIETSVACAALLRLGISLHDASEFEEAGTTFDRLMDITSDDEQIRTSLLIGGESYFQLHAWKNSARMFARLTSEYPGHDSYGAALLRLGDAYAAMQHWKESAAAFAEHAQRYPDDPHHFQASFGIGWALENQGELQDAIKQYARVISSHDGPTAARAQFQIGECLFAQGNHEDALPEFLKVDMLYAYPEWSAASLYESGRCFNALGDIEQATTHLTRVTHEFATSDWAGLAQAELDRMLSSQGATTGSATGSAQ